MTVRLVDLQPRQRLIAESEADVVFYGGGKGGGKSFSVVLEAAKYVDVEGYGAVIFRRTSGELRGSGSLWEESEGIYPHLGGVPIESRLLWRFPSGAEIMFSHFQHEKDRAKWTGKNVAFAAFDECQFMTAKQFWQLFSCLRTTCGVRTRFLHTLNPDPGSWVFDFIKPYLDEAGFPREDMVAAVRYFGRRDGKLLTFGSREEGVAAGYDGLTSYAFVPALIWQNQKLLLKDPSYLEKLRAMPPQERAQFLDGCWYAKQQAGDMLQSAWMPVLHHGTLARRVAGQPDDREIVRWVLSCDLASTPRDGDLVPSCPVPRFADSARNPDWTRMLLLGQFRNGQVVVWDMFSYRDVPGAIEHALIRHIKNDCPRGTVVVMACDPGQAGVHQRDSYAQALRGTARIETGQPLNLAYAASYTARVAYRGMLMLRDSDVAPWLPAFVREIEGYSSDGESRTGHDDIVSALSTGIVYLATKAHPRVAAALPTLDGPMSGENAVRTSTRFRAAV